MPQKQKRGNEHKSLKRTHKVCEIPQFHNQSLLINVQFRLEQFGKKSIEVKKT